MLGAPSPATRDVWFVCHGYGQLAARFIRRFEPIATHERVIVAPEALSRFYTQPAAGEHSRRSQIGATWMTSEDRNAEINDYVAYLNALYDRILSHMKRENVAVRALGFSQGAATVSRWIAGAHAIADQVIIWSGSVAPELTAPQLSAFSTRNPMLVVSGDRDEYIPAARVTDEIRKLDSLSVAYRHLTFDGGHDIDADTLKTIADSPV